MYYYKYVDEYKVNVKTLPTNRKTRERMRLPDTIINLLLVKKLRKGGNVYE